MLRLISTLLTSRLITFILVLSNRLLPGIRVFWNCVIDRNEYSSLVQGNVVICRYVSDSIHEVSLVSLNLQQNLSYRL